MKHESDLVDLYSTNTDEFYSFYMQNHDEIVKYFFVYYICSLSDQNRSFPILIRKKTSGFANDETTADLEEIVFKIRDLGIDVIGISFDGDPSYLKYVDNMCSENQNLDKLNLHLPLNSLFEDFDGILAYEDMLHLTKFDRYRLICGSYICPSLFKDESTFNVDSFRDVGVKDYVLDPLRAKKNG